MRLWHQNLIKYLPRQQLLGQHRECCALRGAGWGRRHSVVNYVFDYDPSRLVAYHHLVMNEMEKRGYHPDPIWRNANWRGARLGEQIDWANDDTVSNHLFNVRDDNYLLYLEHNNSYLEECLENLRGKGIEINVQQM